MNKYILVILLLILIAVPLYFIVYCIVAFFRKIHRFPASGTMHKLAVLIPARNEECVIGNLVQSLMKQDYPREEYDVYVLVNSCTDHTEATAIGNGAKCLHFDDVETKGDVLNHAFDQLNEKGIYDAYVILDADNLAHPEFLKRMNDAYSGGYELIQGRRTGKNVESSWVSCCYEVFYILQNIFFNHARTSFGQNASFNGTGWLISRKYLEKYGFHTYTLVEDLELIALVDMEGMKIGYCHDALIYDEYPSSVRVSMCQLDRWIFGQMQCMRRYAGKLFGTVFTKGYMACMDIGLIFIMPILLLCVIVIFILWLISSPAAASFFGRYILLILLIQYVLMVLFLAACIHKNASSFKQLWKGVFCFPVFALEWAVLLPQNLFRRKMRWKPIVHDEFKRIEEMK